MGTRNKKSANFWLVKVIIFLALAIVGIFGYASLKEIHQKKSIEKEITSLKEQAAKIKQENIQVANKLSYLGSEDYQKMKAKEKLNLQEPGEKVVVLSPGPIKIQQKIIPVNETAITPQEESVPNFRKWWNYFFSNNAL